jgi:hypothetical protein
MPSVREFIEQWDDLGTACGTMPASARRSPFGNVNSSGEPNCEDALVLTPQDRSFPDILEDGVRDLVLAFVRRRRWITYTSCEGHDYSGSGLEPVERHVGLLPRDQREWSMLRGYLDDACRLLEVQSAASAVELALMEQTLVDGSEAFPVLDIYFAVRQGACWAEYFSSLPRRYEQLVAHVNG